MDEKKPYEALWRAFERRPGLCAGVFFALVAAVALIWTAASGGPLPAAAHYIRFAVYAALFVFWTPVIGAFYRRAKKIGSLSGADLKELSRVRAHFIVLIAIFELVKVLT